MTPRSLFIILLRLAGIYFVFATLSGQIMSIYTWISLLINYIPQETNENVLEYVLIRSSLLSVMDLLFFSTIFFLIIMPRILINALLLDKGFQEEKLDINIHAASVIRIAAFIFGGLLFVISLISLFNQIMTLLNLIYIHHIPSNHVINSYVFPLILDIVKIIIACLLVRYNRTIADYVVRKKNKNKTENL